MDNSDKSSLVGIMPIIPPLSSTSRPELSPSRLACC